MTSSSNINREGHLIFLSINDVYDISPNENGLGGIAPLSTLINEQRQKAENHEKECSTVLTVNGDFLSASEAANNFQGSHMIGLLNALQVDLVVFGNHEFDFGNTVLRERMDESNFQWLGSNVCDQSGKPFHIAKDTVVRTMAGFQVGFFGVCTTDTPNLSYPDEDVVFNDYVASAKCSVESLLAQKVDIIVGITHLSIAQDKLLAKKVQGIHLILGGHDHEPYTIFQGETMIHKFGQNAYWLGKVDLFVKQMNGSKLSIYPSWEMIPNLEVAPEPKCDALVQKYLSLIEKDTDLIENERVLAVTTTEINTQSFRLRSCETSMGNLVADAMRSISGAQFALINGGFIRGDKVYDAKTKLTVGMIKKEMPFPRDAVLLKIKAKDFRSAIEEHLKAYPALAGSFPHVSGVEVVYDLNQKPGQRIVVFRDLKRGESIDLESEITVATTKFNCEGGDGCVSWKKGTPTASKGLVADVVIQYLEKMRIVSPIVEKRLQIIECS